MAQVSIIIPNYNHAAYLDQRINSVLNQTFQDFEVIILDDCSTDNSREVIEKYRNHPKVGQIVFNETNSGTTFKQWDKGIKMANGQYIWIAESDDWCENIFLEELITGLKSNNSCVLAYCQSYTVLGHNEIIWQLTHNKLKEYVNGLSFIKKNMVKRNAIFNASMAVFAKDIYNQFSNEFMDFKFCGDWLFWIQAAKQGDVFVSGKTLNFFRKHVGDVSGKAYASGLNFSEEIKILNFLKRNDIVDEDEYKNTLWLKYLNYKSVVNKIPLEASKQINILFYEQYGNILLIKYNKWFFKNRVKTFLKTFIN